MENILLRKKQGLISIFSIGVIVTLIAGIESLPFYPLSPFIFIHALLTVIIPLIYPYFNVKSYLTNSFSNYKRFILKGLFWGIIYIVLFGITIGSFLRTFYLDKDTFWNVLLLYRQVYQNLVFLRGALVTDLFSFIFIVPWAGIAEELFYRGFVYGGLRRKYSITTSLFASSLLFGLRHSLQLLYFLPNYPIAAGIIYFFFSFGAGILLASLFESSKSLLPAIATHLGINFVGFPVLLYIFKTNG